MFDTDYDLRLAWWLEAKAEAEEQNPLTGWVERRVIVRNKRIRRCGPKKGKVRRYSRGIRSEIELIKNLTTGRCVAVKDLRTPGLDALAEEIFADRVIPPHTTPAQLFLDYFRKM